jgi:hypothetical protein
VTFRDGLHSALPRLTTDRTSGYCVALGLNVLKRALNKFQAFSRAVMTQQSKHLYEFGPYRIDPAKRLLLRRGTGSTAFESV